MKLIKGKVKSEVTGSIPAGTNNIGDVDVLSLNGYTGAIAAAVGAPSTAGAVVVGGLTSGATVAAHVVTAPADGVAITRNHLFAAALGMRYNGTTADMERGNIPWVTPLISAARTVSAASGTIRNYNHSRLMARLNVTSAGTGTLSLRVRQTVLSGATVALNEAVTVATAAGWVWELGPGIATTVPAGGAVVQRTLASLPPEFDLYVVSSDGSSWTYSLEYVLML